MALAGWRGVLLALALGVSAHAAWAQGADVAASAGAAAERAFTRAAPRPAWVDPLPLAPAVQPRGSFSILLSDVQIRLDTQSAVYARHAIEIHHAAALDSAGRIDLEFLPAFQTLELHGVAVLRAGQRLDRTGQAEIRFLQRETGLDRGLYSGAVTANIVVPDLRVGDVVDLEYTIRGANPVFGGKLFYRTGWDRAVHVGRRRVVLDLPDGRSVDARMVGAGQRPAPPPRIERRDGRTRSIYEALDQAAVPDQDDLPSGVHAQRWLQFSEMGSWSEVNRWALTLFPQDAGGPAVDALVGQLRAAGSPEQQAVKALQFVQSEVRYLSLSLGENSHRPTAPEAVLARRYGDCKDKSLLLATLLGRLGIAAHVALVATAMPSGLEQLLPSPQLFDHAVVHLRVNGRDYLLDPTRQGQYGSLAQMGHPWQGYQVLVVRPGTTQLTTVDAPAASLPVKRRIDRFELDQPGSPAELTVTHEFSGLVAEDMRSWLAANGVDQHQKQFNRLMAERYPDAAPLGELVVQDDHARNLLRLVSRYRIGALFAKSAGRWRMPFSAANLSDLFNKPDSAARVHPLQASAMREGDWADYELEVLFRQSTALPLETTASEVVDPAFDFKLRHEFGPRRIATRMSVRAGAASVAPHLLPAYAKNLASLEQHLHGAYHITAATPAPTPGSAGDALRARLQQLDAAVANAGFRAADPSVALCERARVRQALEQTNEALADVQQAVRLQPKSAPALLCRAAVHFAAHRLNEAEADYARAAALGASSAELYLGRAVNAAYLGQDTLASAQFRQALASADDPDDRLRAQVWLALLDAAPPTAPTAPPRADGEGGWLAPVLSAIKGGTRPEQAVAAAAGDGGAGSQARLGETYFYLARMLQSKGQRAKALAYFKQALAKLDADHPYYPATRHALVQMEQKKP